MFIYYKYLTINMTLKSIIKTILNDKILSVLVYLVLY